MSKIESAYSKALEEQRVQEGSSDLHPEDARGLSITNDKNYSGKNIAASSRKQIAGMQQYKIFTDEELANRRLISPSMRDEKLLNIYRNIRTKLVAQGGNQNFTTLVTSVVSRGGSSLIAANLAAVFAFDEGKTALLVDGNMHAPALASLFDAESTQGLVDYLESEEVQLDQVLQETGIPRLRFIPTGSRRENSTEYLTSQKMREFLSEVVERYPDRYPIIDAPSVLDSADARILVDLCDYVVLVVPYGQCTEADIKSAVDTVGAGKLAGLVLNQF